MPQKIVLMKAITPRRFVELVTQRNTLSSGVVKNVQESEVETLIGLLKEGCPVHTGIAIFTPIIDSQGNLSVSVRVDTRITAALNVPGEFTGEVKNSENIGMTSAEMAIKWNSDFPDNLIALSETKPFRLPAFLKDGSTGRLSRPFETPSQEYNSMQ